MVPRNIPLKNSLQPCIQVWIPDVVLLNCADGEGNVIQKHTDIVSLDYTGASYWFPKVKFCQLLVP